jgi:opacity protein-like surface antigen
MSPNTCLNRCRLIALFVLSMLISGISGLTAEAKDWKGTHEFSISANGGTTHGRTEYLAYNGITPTSTRDDNYFNVNFRYGYFIYKGLEFEPELIWTVQKFGRPGFSVHGNVAYNFDFAPDSARYRFIPFILVGYSVGTTIPEWLHEVPMDYWAKTRWSTVGLGVGAGVKAFVAPRVALRMEYRYESYHQNRHGSVLHSNYHNTDVMAGFSIFFPPCKKGCSTACAK